LVPTHARRSVAIFDLGGVLIDWNPRHLYRKLFAGDEAAMEHFLATVCTTQWNERQDAGRSFTEAMQELLPLHADKVELIEAFGKRFSEMIPGAIEGSVERCRSSVRRASRRRSTRSPTGRRRLFRRSGSDSRSCRGSRASSYPGWRA
jgi:hypothetical protein